MKSRNNKTPNMLTVRTGRVYHLFNLCMVECFLKKIQNIHAMFSPIDFMGLLWKKRVKPFFRNVKGPVYDI